MEEVKEKKPQPYGVAFEVSHEAWQTYSAKTVIVFARSPKEAKDKARKENASLGGFLGVRGYKEVYNYWKTSSKFVKGYDTIRPDGKLYGRGVPPEVGAPQYNGPTSVIFGFIGKTPNGFYLARSQGGYIFIEDRALAAVFGDESDLNVAWRGIRPPEANLHDWIHVRIVERVTAYWNGDKNKFIPYL